MVRMLELSSLRADLSADLLDSALKEAVADVSDLIYCANNDALLKRLLGQRVRAVLIEKEVRSGRDETKRTYTLESAELLEQ